MKKKLISLLLIPTLLFAGCADNPLEHSYDIEAAYSRPEQEPTTDLPPVDNTTPFDPDKDPIDIHAVAEKFFVTSRYTLTLADISTEIGIQYLRENEAGTLYSIHPVQQGGRLLLFYQNFEPHSIIRWFYVAENISYKDFQVEIQHGDSIRDVKRILPSVQIFENIYKSDSDFWDKEGGIGTWHYLNDGILKLGFQIEEGKFTLSVSQFKDDFDVQSDSNERYMYCDGHLLPIDALDTWES